MGQQGNLSSLNISFNYIQAFLTLAETLSFSKAAKAMAVSQPSISRQIKLLEEQLDCQLFIRDTHRVVLTEQGRILREKLKPHLNQIMEAFQDLQEDTGELRGKIALGTLQEIGQTLVTPATLAFQKNHPGVSLDIRYMETFRIVEDLKQARLEFAIVPFCVETESVRCFELFDEEIVFVTRASNNASLDQFSEKNPARFVLYREEDPLADEYLRKYRSKIKLKHWFPYVYVNSHRSMIDALLNTDCYSVMPYFNVLPHINSGQLKLVHEQVMTSKFYLLHHAHSHMERRLAEFKKHIINHFRKVERLT